jgi:TRAP-type uncharacterized transport system substrate-binding protein
VTFSSHTFHQNLEPSLSSWERETTKMRGLLSGAALVALVAFAAPARAQNIHTIRLCTGDTGGNYHAVGEMIKSFADSLTKIEVIKDTGGTWGNIQRTFVGNDCDAMIGQPDGAAVLKRSNPAVASKMRKVGTLHREFLHVVCSKDSGVTELEQLEKDPKGHHYSVAIGAEGSGADLIWQNFENEDADYKEIPVQRLGGVDALAAISTNDVTCGLFPAGLGNSNIREADTTFGENLVLASATDWDFNDAPDADGKPLYKFDKIPSRTYPNSLQKGFFTGTKTLSWLAGVYINTERVKKEDLPALIRAVANASKQARAQFGE